MAFRTKKISQMDPKGSNLASTDLLEISQLVSGSYVTKSITGAEIIGGATTGFVPTTRTLTINGTTQDLSANRTFTVSTGITIGTTAITSGTVGRVLFEGTGNVVQESANLFWDNTNGRLGIGGTPSAFKLDIVGTSSANIIGVKVRNTSTNGYTEINCYNNTGGDNDRIYFGVGGTATGDVYQNRGYFISSLALEGITFTAGKTTTGDMRFFTGGNNERLRIFGNGNVGINTTTDAGYKLDVNGTARVKGTGTTSATTAFTVQNSAGSTNLQCLDNGAVQVINEGNFSVSRFGNVLLSTGQASSSLSTYTNSVSLSTGVVSIVQGTVATNFRGEYTETYGRFITMASYKALDASAQMEVFSTTKGFLPPRMTTTQKNAIATPATGLMVYDTTLNLISVYNGTSWISL